MSGLETRRPTTIKGYDQLNAKARFRPSDDWLVNAYRISHRPGVMVDADMSIGNRVPTLCLGLIQHVETLWNLTRLLARKLGHGG
jgi:hypothetical protein